MNHIALHPARTGTNELVPSRYALRVGEIDVLVISDGVLQTLKSKGRFEGFSDPASYADINGFLAADLRARRTLGI